MTLKTVSVVGLGKLDAPMTGCFASKGLRVTGVDADAVTEAIGLDSRIGSKYLRGGLGPPARDAAAVRTGLLRA